MKCHTLRKRIAVLALSRYYTSEWFQRTHVPLVRTVVAPYKINVAYGKDGIWHINQTDKFTSGIVAEYLVFQELLRCVRNPASQLYAAQIVPNIYLPHQPKGRKAEKLWSQLDCVLLTRQAAFVLEVKRRHKRIVAPGNFEEIWSTIDDSLVDSLIDGSLGCLPEMTDFTDESFALVQNSRHAVAFDEACDDYPFECIYEQVVFVGTKSFYADSIDFIDNINVASLGRGELTFSEIIEKKCTNADEIISQQKLDKLGESLVSTYGDLNQKRGQLHAQRIKNIQQSK